MQCKELVGICDPQFHRKRIFPWVDYVSQKRGGVVKDAHGLWGPLRIYGRINKTLREQSGRVKLCCLQRRTNGNNVQISELEINKTAVELAVPYFTTDKNKTEGGRASIT